MKNLCITWCIFAAFFCIEMRQANSQDIYSAVAEGDVELTKKFLEKNPALLNLRNPDLLTALNLAAERGQVEVAAFLLKMGADPSIGDRENSQPFRDDLTPDKPGSQYEGN